MFKKAMSQRDAAVKASLIVAAEIGKKFRPFTEGELVKKCSKDQVIKVYDLMCTEKKQAFSSVSLNTCDLATNLYD